MIIFLENLKTTHDVTLRFSREFELITVRYFFITVRYKNITVRYFSITVSYFSITTSYSHKAME